MKIFEMDLDLSAFDTQSNIKLPFIVKDNHTSMTIYFTYSPDKSCDYIAREQVRVALDKYKLPDATAEDLRVKNYLPVDNLITLSLSKNGQYLGGHHNKSNEQEIILSEQATSHGFWPVKIEPANWELQLNCHCIASMQVVAKVRIEVADA
ncbi:hypothetical protein ACF3NG_00160 [Aerococcaceae bacterium WGS1372]